MSNLKWRFALIGALVLASAWALYPRDVKVRQRRADGTFFDTTTYRVPLRKGLDLSGGMHLALEVDDSKGVVANKSDFANDALACTNTVPAAVWSFTLAVRGSSFRLPVFVALCLAAMATRNRTFHAVLVIGTILYQISFILRLFDTLS